MDNIKSNIKAVVGSCAFGLAVNSFANDYFTLTQSHLDYRALGFESMQHLLRSVPDVVEVYTRSGQAFARMARCSGDPRCLDDLVNLVHNTAVHKQRAEQSRARASGGAEAKGRRPPRGGARASRARSAGSAAEPADAECWYARPHLAFDPFLRTVRVLGVQGGHAIVAEAACKLGAAPLPATPAPPPFPGDMVLWKPDCGALHAERGVVDLCTVFPAVVVVGGAGGARAATVQVRVLGLLAVLAVPRDSLYAMPRARDALRSLAQRVRSRAVTLVPLALVPRDADVRLASALHGLFEVLAAADRSGSVLEQAGARGAFLNVRLLGEQRRLAASWDAPRQRALLRHLAACVQRAEAALLPAFEARQAPLRPVRALADCRGATLLATAGDGRGLRRLRYCEETASFCGVDSRAAEGESLAAKDGLPPRDVVAIDAGFVSAPGAASEDLLRLHAAVLLSVPSLAGTAASWGLEAP